MRNKEIVDLVNELYQEYENHSLVELNNALKEHTAQEPTDKYLYSVWFVKKEFLTYMIETYKGEKSD